jgi:hypothetical protein
LEFVSGVVLLSVKGCEARKSVYPFESDFPSFYRDLALVFSLAHFIREDYYFVALNLVTPKIDRSTVF